MSTTSENIKVKKDKKKIIETVGIVSEMQRETPDTQTLRIKMPNLDPSNKPFQFKPGQFVMVRPEIVNGLMIDMLVMKYYLEVPMVISFGMKMTQILNKFSWLVVDRELLL